MIKDKSTHQYVMFIATAISKCRKACDGKVSYVNVIGRLNISTAFTYYQWGGTEGWFCRDGIFIYEAPRTKGMPMSEILAMLHERYEC